MSQRSLQSVLWSCAPTGDVPVEDAAFTQWIIDQARRYNLQYALVYADDGVIWGFFDNGRWSWSSDAFSNVSPPLRLLTLQQARLFGPTAEMLIWRESHQMRGRVLVEGAGDEGTFFDEAYLLWGYRARRHGQEQNGFRLMQEGAQDLRHAPPMQEGTHGLRHAPPIAIAEQGKLWLRNYVAFDDDGCAYVQKDRLVVREAS